DHPGRVRGHLSVAERTERDASRDAAERDAFGGDLQCLDHHLPDSARAEGRALARRECRRAAAAQPAGLRARRHRGAVRRDQAAARRSRHCLNGEWTVSARMLQMTPLAADPHQGMPANRRAAAATTPDPPSPTHPETSRETEMYSRNRYTAAAALTLLAGGI